MGSESSNNVTAEVKPNTDVKYATNVVVWTGATAETFETPVAFWGDGTRRFTLRNEGTAALTAGMSVTLDGTDGNISLKLDGATAPVIYGVSLGTAKMNILDSNGFGLHSLFDGRCRMGKYMSKEALYIATRTG